MDTTETTSTLTEAQAKAVAALARGATITAAAAEAGVHRTTVYKWIHADRQFHAAAEEARDEYGRTIQDQLAEMSCVAVDIIRDVLCSANAPKSLRIRTAFALLARPRFPKQEWPLPKPGALRLPYIPDYDEQPDPATPATPVDQSVAIHPPELTHSK
jgi:transposase-like protein